MGIKVWEYGAGTAVRMSLEVTEAEHRAFFSNRDWNAIVRAGLWEAGKEWIELRLPLRFTDFARQIGYNAKSKRTGGTPLVEYGRLRQFLLSKAYPEARVTSSRTQLILRLPTPTMLNRSGHGVHDTGVLYTANAIVNRVITTITNEELLRIAESMVATIERLIEGASYRTGKVATKASLSVTQRQSIAHTVKPQGSIHKPRSPTPSKVGYYVTHFSDIKPV